MKGIILTISGLLLLAKPAGVQAQFNYTTNNGTIVITGYTGSGGAVTIPSTINGLPVSSINDFAFVNNSNLTSVTTLNNLTSIGNYAFPYCSSLTNLAIANSVTNLGRGAFQFCIGLSTVTIPDSVTSIGASAFGGCSSLTAIMIGTLNSVYSSVDGVLFKQNQTTIVECPGARTGAYTIPNGVTNIGEAAFSYCARLTSITIPNGVTDIADNAFFSCTSLPTVTIPASVTSIGRFAFERCDGLTSITIPNGVTNIGDDAFSSCASLTNVAIPRSVTSIGTEAFVNCSSLTAITVDTSNSVFSSVNGVLFNKSQTTLIQYPGGAAGTYVVPNIVTSIGAEAFAYHGTLTSVAIPNTVTSIGWDAFAFCSSLTSINIGNSVTSIESYAFYDCTNLNGVYFNGNAPNLGEYVFAYDNNATVYYLPGTTGWGPVFAGRPTALWKPQVQTSDASFGVRSNQFTFKINWASDMVVVVEACTNLANPTWSALGTNTIIGGSSYFSDPQWTNCPNRFYRLRSP